jgi:hypothetical protein
LTWLNFKILIIDDSANQRSRASVDPDPVLRSLSPSSESSEIPSSPPKSPSPEILPSISLHLEWKFNGKQLPGSRQRVIPIERKYNDFLVDLKILCAPKLPTGKKWYSTDVTIGFEWAWITVKQASAKISHFTYSGLDEEDDFITIQHAVRISKNPQDMVLKIRAFISIDSIDEDIEPTSSQVPNGRPV